MADLYKPSEAEVRQYSANVTLLAQQEGSRLGGTVRTDSTVVGSRAMFTAYGKGTMQARTSPHADTYLADTARQTRSAAMIDYERGELVAQEHQLKTLHDPKNPLALVGANAAGLKKDQVIYDALGGSATEGAGDGAAFSTVALPASQQIAVGGTGMTFDKVRQAVGKLMGSGSWFMRMDGMNQRYGVLSAAAHRQLLNEVEVKDGDHNASARDIIQSGDMDGRTWMGITWYVLPDGVVAQNGSLHDLIYVWLKGAVGLGLNKDIYTSFDRRPDKSNAMQILVKLHGGAVRVDDLGVVQIAIDPTIV